MLERGNGRIGPLGERRQWAHHGGGAGPKAEQ